MSELIDMAASPENLISLQGKHPLTPSIQNEMSDGSADTSAERVTSWSWMLG